MNLQNIHGYKTIDEYIKYKISRYDKTDKSFESLFDIMFDEADNVMVETSDGYHINKTTYGQFKENITSIVPTVAEKLSKVEAGQYVGLYMQNSPQWLMLFWAILICGFRPLIMNTRLSTDVLNKILADYNVSCVISDGTIFNAETFLKDDLCVPSSASFKKRTFGDEVVFMSSGSSGNVKLCAYSGENFYHQISNSVHIITECPAIKTHYEGQLKHLMLLPLCHIFGFIAVYLWFGFFSRTFVFPKDLNPLTIQRTVKKHKVTHIFAVPMVWEAVHKATLNKIKERGDKTFNRFKKALAFVNKHGVSGNFIRKKAFNEIRENLFGDSVQFLISGGSHILPSTLQFFNGIGYHLANGYGMTEIGITSLETSDNRKILNSSSIGTPFYNTEYSLDDNGILLVRSKSRASRILQGGNITVSDFNQWFNTGDIMRFSDGRYFSNGRADDLLIGHDGENLSPQIAEEALSISEIERLCIFPDESGAPILLASVPGCFNSDRLDEIHLKLKNRMAQNKLDSAINKIYFTHEYLLSPGEFKLNRKKIAQRFNDKNIRVFEPTRLKEHISALEEGLEAELLSCLAQVLDRDKSTIGRDDNFFLDLNGTSMDYFVLIGTIKSRMGIELAYTDGVRLTSIGQIADYIKNQSQKKS